jgi:hypothetical protein
VRRSKQSNKARKRVARLGRAKIGSDAVEMPLDETRVEFDEGKVDRIVSDTRDHAELNARRETQDKYE